MEIERQAIERHDFPVARRGYDPASVDAHLREIADRVEQLTAGAAPTVATTAGTQVQSIIATAESAAAEIRRAAHDDAERAREQALADARSHVAAVSVAAAALLERVSAVDEALRTVLENTRSATAQLVRDLAALEQGSRELFEAAAARAPEPAAQTPERDEFPIPTEVPASSARGRDSPPAAAVPSKAPHPNAGDDGDADSARLVALNMALGGESRADTERYLAEHFRLSDPLKLVDEVYAAIEA